MQVLIPLFLSLLVGPRLLMAAATPEAGQAVVVGGANATVTPCFLCHGLDGRGDAAAAFPRLAGQAGFYLYKQLIDYASDARPNKIMTPIARAMTEQQMQDVAAYYRNQSVPYPAPTEEAADLLEQGRRIAENGVPAAGVQACGYCHGRQGAGIPPSFPYLMGQYAPYLELQLRLWKQDIRRNDPLEVMRQIAKQLSDDDIRALAHYFATIRPESATTSEATRNAPSPGRD